NKTVVYKKPFVEKGTNTSKKSEIKKQTSSKTNSKKSNIEKTKNRPSQNVTKQKPAISNTKLEKKKKPKKIIIKNKAKAKKESNDKYLHNFYYQYLDKKASTNVFVKIVIFLYPMIFCLLMTFFGKDILLNLSAIPFKGRVNSTVSLSANINFWVIIGLFFAVAFYVGSILQFQIKANKQKDNKFKLNKYIFKHNYLMFFFSGIIGFFIKVIFDVFHAFSIGTGLLSTFVFDSFISFLYDSVLLFLVLFISLFVCLAFNYLLKKLVNFFKKQSPILKNYLKKKWQEL
ncbi:MAG: hypothetical protein RR640_00960, partial [Oscillospiraceae bacterium]